MTFSTIVADPPWEASLGSTWTHPDKGRPQRFYPTMTVEEICDLSVPAADQAHLYLWAVSQRVDWAYRVAHAWGFAPIILMTWRKPGVGVGRFQCNTEHVLVARKGSRHGNPFGSGGRHAPATNGTCFDWPRGRRHSEKPEEFYALVERLSPSPRLEMFARKSRPGWSVWGNEVESDVVITPRYREPLTQENIAVLNAYLEQKAEAARANAADAAHLTKRGPEHG